MRPRPFTGCVLTGGSSVRMGTDKALLDVGGVPLASIPAAALAHAGADSVFCLGGDVAALRSAGLDAYPDTAPGSGPLAAIIDGFAIATTDTLVVLACDLPKATAAAVMATVEGLRPPFEASMPQHDGLPQYLHAAYHRSLLQRFTDAVEAGERSLRYATAGARVATVTVPDAASLADADHPEDLE